jgi:hypothetical protein
MKKIDDVLEYYKNRLNVILSDKIGNFIYPDKNTGKALLVIPDKVFGSNYPPSGTTLQNEKVGVVLRLGDQDLTQRFEETDIKIRVSVFTNSDVSILTECWELISNAPLPILGSPQIKNSTVDPAVKNFLIFNILTSI